MSTKSPVAVSGKRVASRCPTLLESVPGRVNPEVRSGASWSAPMTPRAAAATQAAATVLGRREAPCSEGGDDFSKGFGTARVLPGPPSLAVGCSASV